MPKPGFGWKGRTQARHTAPPFNGGDERCLLAANESASTFFDREAQWVVGAEEFLAQPAALRARVNGGLDPADRERVFMTDVEDAFVRSDSDRGDGQPLDDAEGERFQNHSIHKGAGIAFVAVANNILGWLGLLANDAPLRAGGESRPAAAAEAG